MSKLYYKDKYNKIYNGDALDVLSNNIKTPIDLIISSPPYNVNLGNNKYNKNPYDVYNDNKSHKDYIKFLKDIFTQCYKLLVSGGRVALNIGDSKNGKIPTHVDVTNMMVNLGFLPMSIIIWNKNQTSNRAAWGSWKSPSCPSFPMKFEYILIFAKDSYKLQKKGDTCLSRDEFIEYTNSIWNIKPETKLKEHPAPFPLELPKRLIKMLTWKNSIVLDPFVGIGTTLEASKTLGRRSIGIDISKDYCELSKNRVLNIK